MTSFAFIQEGIAVDDVVARVLTDGRPRVCVDGVVSMQFDAATARRFANNLAAAADAADALAGAQA